MDPVVVAKAPNMTPQYEVKLQLDPSKVLGFDHEVLSIVLQNFNVPTGATKMNVQFLDKCSKEIYAAGWSLRMRKFENKQNLELNYKKRYNIENGDIDTALTRANEDGFDAKDTNYEAEIEWGYAKQTLSISREKNVPHTGIDQLELMGIADSRAILTKQAPDKFDNWGTGNNWGTHGLAASGLYGPILAKRWVGQWNKIKKVSIEVWPLLDTKGTDIEFIVEASFKTDDYTTASTERKSLTEHLEEKGWLLAEDSLKTKLIMERYSCPRVSGRML